MGSCWGNSYFPLLFSSEELTGRRREVMWIGHMVYEWVWWTGLGSQTYSTKLGLTAC